MVSASVSIITVAGLRRAYISATAVAVPATPVSSKIRITNADLFIIRTPYLQTVLQLLLICTGPNSPDSRSLQSSRIPILVRV